MNTVSNWRSNSIRFSSSNRIELLGEFETICKPGLAQESGDPGVQFDKKTRDRKSREIGPLMHNRVKSKMLGSCRDRIVR
jgi:hypothetical protein